MKTFLPTVACIAVLLLASSGSSQNLRRDSKAIGIVKNLSVSKLDRRLKFRSFSNWFGSVVRNSRTIGWEVNDCGEQDGSGRQKDFPICVQASGTTKDKLEIVVMIVVGSHKRGIRGKPSVWGLWINRESERPIEMNELSQLAGELIRLRI